MEKVSIDSFKIFIKFFIFFNKNEKSLNRFFYYNSDMIKVWPKTGREIYWPSRTPGEWPEINSVGPLSRHFSYIFIEKKKRNEFIERFFIFIGCLPTSLFISIITNTLILSSFFPDQMELVFENIHVYTRMRDTSVDRIHRREEIEMLNSQILLLFSFCQSYTHTHILWNAKCVYLSHTVCPMWTMLCRFCVLTHAQCYCRLCFHFISFYFK